MTTKLKPIEYYFDANARKDTIKVMSDLAALQILPEELQSYQKDKELFKKHLTKLFLTYHPDKYPDDVERTTTIFKRLQQAIDNFKTGKNNSSNLKVIC